MESLSAKYLFSSKDPSILVVDIRDEHHFRHGHVKGSINIDVYNDLHEGNFDIVREKLKTLPKNKTIITVCNAGITAQGASAILEEMGYKTAVLEYGMIGWNAINREL
ncbi:MAG TPA: rhodanese-like domain-containing protein [Candidatus Nanoarchaeia archaeon]|nr:rhodanese-like domain-containing protein [Candidatus Nanoarchaeia archaeon]